MAGNAKKKIDGVSAAIAVINVLIVGVIITLCVLIYLYMSGQLEPADVPNLGGQTGTEQITTTPVSMVNITTTPTSSEPTSDTTDTETEAVSETEDTDTIVAVETDSYDAEFFENDMFIGDSISTGLTNYGYFTSDQVFAAIGLNPESALTHEVEGETCVARAEKLKPKRIYIMLGSNGLSYLGNTYMADRTKALIEALREASPDSYLYLISIPPVTKDHESEGNETMAMVNGYNKLLKDTADEIGVVYLDLCSKLQNSSGYFDDDLAEEDGMHFRTAAYRRMLSFLQKSIQIDTE